MTSAQKGTLQQLIIIIYLLLLLDGILRKWLLPSYHEIIYFIRDPVLLLLYIYALAWRGIWLSPLLILLAAFAALSVPVSLVTIMAYDQSPVAILLGIRSYFAYVPLAFIIPKVFDSEALRRFARLNFVIAVPMAVLVLVQITSAPDAWINKAIAADEFAVGVVEGIVRPYGTFTFTSGHKLYVSTLLPWLLAVWLDPNRFPIGMPLRIAGSVAIVILAMTTGSRFAVGAIIVVMLCLLLAFVSAGRGDRKVTRAVTAAVVIGLVGFLFASAVPWVIEAMQERQRVAVEGEGSTLGRAMGGLYSFLYVMPGAPAIGYGLGAGTVAAAVAVTGRNEFLLAENEFERIILELGPALGLIFIALRVSVAAALVGKAVAANRAAWNPLPVLLLGTSVLMLVGGQLTASILSASFGWLYVGLVFAAARAAPGRGAAEGTPRRIVARGWPRAAYPTSLLRRPSPQPGPNRRADAQRPRIGRSRPAGESSR